MLNSDENYKTEVMKNIYSVCVQDLLPQPHWKFLEFLNKTLFVEPKVIFDIGSAVLHWERHAKRIWPNSFIVCFDAFAPLEELYKNQKINYQMACLSNQVDIEQKNYQNDIR